MQLSLPEDSVPVKDMFERFFATESTFARVRAAEPVGFDTQLWKDLLELEAPFMRMPAAAGGGDMSLFDACLMMEQAGRRLAPAPLAEALVALRVLGQIDGVASQQWIAKVRDEGAVLALALRPLVDGQAQLVPGGAVASGVLGFDGKWSNA